MKKRLLSTSPFVWMIFLLLLLAQCKKPELNIPNPNPVPGLPITDDQRLAVINTVENAFSVLNNTDSATALPQLLLYLQSQPMFEASGISDSSNCAWARFTDGRLLLIADNRQPSAFDTRGGRISGEPEESNGGRIGELPEKAPVLLLNAMGTLFINSPAKIKPIFDGKGYQFPVGDASVDGLKKINTEDNAIFFLNTHGGNGNTRDTATIAGKPYIIKRYGFWTTDKVSKSNEAKFADDLNKDRLVYFAASMDEPTKGKKTCETHYAFTDEFVKEYMTFGKNSMIYLDACGSYNNDMITAFHNKSKEGESVYLGWTNNAGDQASYKAAKFVFDRLLGANQPSSPKEDPPQRPFDIDAVYKDVVNRGLDKYSYKDDKTNAAIVSKLQYSSKIGTKGTEDPRFILAPSIEYLEIDEFESELTINGIFGEDPRKTGGGEITVNEVPVQSIKTWTKDKIVCKIAYQGNGSAGDVVVSVRGHESNPVPLTEWYIDFSMKQGTKITIATAYTLHLRADVHRRRTEPGEKNPKPAGQGTSDQFPFLLHSFAKDSKATLTAGGSCSFNCTKDGCVNSFSYSAVGIKEFEINKIHANGEPGLTAKYGWENREKLTVLIGLVSQSHLENHNLCGQVFSNAGQTDYVILTLNSSGDLAELPQLVFTNPDKFDFTIQANSFKFPAAYNEAECVCQSTNELYGTIEWKASKPNFPPTDKTPARVGLVLCHLNC